MSAPMLVTIFVAIICGVIPGFRIRKSRTAAAVILKGIAALRNNEAYDREALRQACQQFPRDQYIMDLAAWPLTMPVPNQLLDQVGAGASACALAPVIAVQRLCGLIGMLVMLGAIARIAYRLLSR